MRHLFLTLAAFAAFVLCAPPASAEIRKADLAKHATLTQGALLLQQVDTVSLYLSSGRVVFAPRLVSEKLIEVEATVLAPDLIADKGKMQGFVTRLIATFISVLKERLPVYAPAVAERFDASSDIVFNVDAGSSRIPVGSYKGGAWQFAAGEVPAQAASAGDLNEARASESSSAKLKPGRKGCGCPAGY